MVGESRENERAEPVGLVARIEAVLGYPRARRKEELLASRLERLNAATLQMSRAEGLSELVLACAEQSASVLESWSVVRASGDGQVVIARASPSGRSSLWRLDGLEGLERLEGPTSVLGVDRLPTADEAFTIRGIDRDSPLAGFDPGRVYRAVPVQARKGGGWGVVAVERMASDADDLEEADLVLRQVGRALGVALWNLHALGMERTMALQLQHSLLPATLPEIEGLEVAVRYVASSEHVEVGGDFFEVLELPSGRVGVAIGDVQGHSLDAAVVMAGLRHSLRAYALEGHRPATILSKVNQLMLWAYPSLTATACYGEIDLDTGQMVVASSGHIPPIVSTRAATGYVATTGALLGVDSPAPVEVKVALGEEATVLWVTDGLLERRSESLEVGLGRLLEAVGAKGGHRRGASSGSGPESGRPGEERLEDLCDRLLGLVGPEGATDDVALVAVRLTRRPSR